MSVLRVPLGYLCIMSIALACLIVRLPVAGPWTWQTRAYLLVVIVASTKAVSSFFSRLPNPVRDAKMIHGAIHRLVDSGYTRFLPPDATPQIAYLRIAVLTNGHAVVYLVNWDEYHGGPSRKFVIQADGTVHRSRHDDAWSKAPLAPLLEGLLTVLRQGSPRLEMDRVRRREDR